ncbi:MAG: hypothetical protein CSYNP_00453 [Syntrophus sp. SKADARSKE-3]|nr:hypothetical protein [Syntrophus sp. SKADARSKE-3]
MSIIAPSVIFVLKDFSASMAPTSSFVCADNCISDEVYLGVIVKMVSSLSS